mmetsp:Transcript_71254/g.155267  ORF Transcript_71254/g.155267 Transcript_71254/m.155267 type:complete len:256 (+) Transcript_71254:65-832(+)
MRPCTLTGSGDTEASLRRWDSNEDTRWRLSIEILRARAVCCRSAFKKTSGLKKSLKATGSRSGFPDERRRSQSPLRACILAPKPWRKMAGSSGADGQVADHAGGTSDWMRYLASAIKSGVLNAVPAMTFCMVFREAETISPSLPASEASIKTNATTGESSGFTARTSTFLTLEIWAFCTLSQSWKRGPSWTFQALTSTPAEEAAPPSADPAAAASIRRVPMTLVELIRWRDRSELGAIPKDCGLSISGISSTLAR